MTRIFASAGTAKTPPVPTNKDVKLGICPKSFISVDDLNLLPSDEIKLRFWSLLLSVSLSLRGRLLVIISWTDKSEQKSKNKGSKPLP